MWYTFNLQRNITRLLSILTYKDIYYTKISALTYNNSSYFGLLMQTWTDLSWLQVCSLLNSSIVGIFGHQLGVLPWEPHHSCLPGFISNDFSRRTVHTKCTQNMQYIQPHKPQNNPFVARIIPIWGPHGQAAQTVPFVPHTPCAGVWKT